MDWEGFQKGSASTGPFYRNLLVRVGIGALAAVIVMCIWVPILFIEPFPPNRPAWVQIGCPLTVGLTFLAVSAFGLPLVKRRIERKRKRGLRDG